MKKDKDFWDGKVYKINLDTLKRKNYIDAWGHGALRVMLRTLLAKKYGLNGNLADFPISRAMDHIAGRRYGKEGPRVVGGLDEINVERALKDVEEYMRNHPLTYNEEMLKDFKTLFPVALEAAKVIGKFMDKWTRMEYQNKHGIPPDPGELMLDFGTKVMQDEGKDPLLYLPNFLTPEEIKKIDVAHRLLYELLEEKRHARLMFEKKSGVEDLLNEDEIRENEELVKKILQTRKWPLPEEETQPQKPGKSEVAPSQKVSPEASKGQKFALFTDKELAEEFARLKGGRVVEAGSKLWRVEVAEPKSAPVRRTPEPAKEPKVEERRPEPKPKTIEKPTKEPEVKKTSEQEQSLKERRKLSLHDLITEKPEVHFKRAIPFVENGDQIIVLPPHKPFEEIQNLGEEPAVPNGYKIVVTAIENGLDLETLEKVVNEMLAVIREVRLSGMKNKPRKKLDKLLYELRMGWSVRISRYESLARARKDRALLAVLETGREVLVDSYERLKKLRSYRRDNLVYELAMEEVSIAEALNLAKEILENPEKYGLNEKDERRRRKRIAETLRKIMKDEKVAGFFNRERILNSQ